VKGGLAVGDEVVAGGVEEAVGSAGLLALGLTGHGAIAICTGESMIRVSRQKTAKT